jgi:NAD(P)-dependent dehydrogenase (short-subunit alcohol dehydrogenase family)
VPAFLCWSLADISGTKHPSYFVRQVFQFRINSTVATIFIYACTVLSIHTGSITKAGQETRAFVVTDTKNLRGVVRSFRMAVMSIIDLIQPYAEVHANPQGPGDARPTALQIIEDEGLIMKWTDKTIMITGGSSGIGIETARALHYTGAQIFITTRDLAKAEKVCEDILASSSCKKQIGIIEMELDSLASVTAGVQDFLSQSVQLSILINNAGVMAAPKGKTVGGFETHMGTNHFSHFLLTKLLLPTLVASSTASFPSRIINVASMGHWHQEGGLGAPGVLDDLSFDTIPYQPMVAYGRSKHANILHASAIERRYGSDPLHPVHAFSLHPGGITTELWRHLGSAPHSPESEHFKKWKSPEQGAATSVWCAAAKVWDGRAGRYCEDCGESAPSSYKTRAEWVPGTPGYAPWAYDSGAEQKLWALSEKAIE